MTAVRSWFFSGLTLIAFGATLLWYDIRGRIALRSGLRPFEKVMASLQATLLRVFAISGVTVDVEGLEHFADHGGFIFVSNHQSMFDVPIFGGILTRNYPKYVAKKELARGIPSISLNLRQGGNALIDRGERKQAVAAIAEMGATCQQRDVSAVIFPEGTRSRDGSLGDYKLLGLATLMKSSNSLPIIPTVIDGSWRVFEHNMLPVPFGASVRVRFGEPIDRTPDETPGDVAEQCRSFATATLSDWSEG